MDHIFVRSDFAERHEYRLVAMDDAWVKGFDERACVTSPPAAPDSVPRKRRRHSESVADASVVFVMKGEDQLCLHDATSTRTVRRVEYSNVLMLAHRRLNAVGRSAIDASAAAADTTADAALSLQRVREYHDDVVIASLSRMFDTHAANPPLDVVTALADTYLTIDELEATDGNAGQHAPPSTVAGAAQQQQPHPQDCETIGCTFAELTRRLHSSPAELAQVLQRLGAVVHRGRVRLLHPLLVFEALGAVLTYLDAADPAEASWVAVREHLCPSVYPDVVLRALQAVYGVPASPPVKEKKEEATKVDDDGGADHDDDVSVVGMVGLLNIPRVLIGLAAGIFDTHDAVTRRTLSTGEVVRGLPLEAFLEKWWDSIPSSLFGTAGIPLRHDPQAVRAFLEKLRGCAVVEPRAGSTTQNSSSTTAVLQGTLWWMPKEVLTNDFAARLRVLFELRPQRWDLAELQAYMGVLLAPDQSFQHIMVRYAREYRIPGQSVQYAPLT